MYMAEYTTVHALLTKTTTQR